MSIPTSQSLQESQKRALIALANRHNGNWYLCTYPNGIQIIEKFSGLGEVDVKRRATGNPVIEVNISFDEEMTR